MRGEQIMVEETTFQERRTGLEDVTRSVRALARTARGLGSATADVAERELAMAITISEQLRDGVFSEAAIKKSRQGGVMASLRQDAHRTVDLVADVGTIAFNSVLDFFENFADQPRRPIEVRPTEPVVRVEPKATKRG
jgi:hypothetical protein